MFCLVIGFCLLEQSAVRGCQDQSGIIQIIQIKISQRNEIPGRRDGPDSAVGTTTLWQVVQIFLKDHVEVFSVEVVRLWK